MISKSLKNAFLALGVTQALAVSASAFTVILSATGTGQIMSASSTPLDFGDAVRVGHIAEGDLSEFSSSNDFSALDALFVPLAESIADRGTLTPSPNPGSPAVDGGLPFVNDAGMPSVDGDIGHTITGVDIGFGSGSGTQLYLWVFNASDPANATEWGIFTGPLFATPAVDFAPALVLGSGIMTVTVGATTVTDGIVRGSSAVGGFALAPIPEPSSAILMLTALTLVFRRRRS